MDSMMLGQIEDIGQVMDQITEWVLITDVSGNILYANPQVEKISGYSYEELIGNNPSVLKSELVPRQVYTKLWNTILKGDIYKGTITNRHKDNSLYYLASTIYPIKDKKGNIKYFIAINKDVTSNGELAKQIHTSLHYDGLTGLLNRNSFIEKVSEAKRHSENIAVLAITINKLGLINSRYGFVCGDRVIKEVGSRIKKILCNLCDDYVVSRPEGKVFGVLVTNYKNTSTIVQLIHKIEESMKIPMEIADDQIHISLTFGISTFQKNVEEEIRSDALLTRAQLALSTAKDSSTLYNYEFYTPSMNKQANDLICKENEIHAAYENDEFISYFQPFIDLETGKVSGLEALMRRKTAGGEVITPIQFISLLEDTGLIVEVGYSLTREICIQIRSWLDTYGYCMPISINLSPVQFKDKHFYEKIIKIIEEEGVSPELITFEITESMLIEDINRTVEILERLRLKGFSVSIDDFGTGYSSLSYIQKFKINHIKIDMSFVRNIVESERDQSIVKAIIMMAGGLSVGTIAEGVENIDQLELLKNLGCDIGQGYLWDKPLPADEITAKYFKNI